MGNKKQVLSQLEFINAIKANDNSVLKKIYTDNYIKVEAYILRNSGDKTKAKDIYQDAFLSFWKNIKQDKFLAKNEGSINGYLYTIAKHKWMDFLRSKDYKKTLVTDDVYHLSTAGDLNDDNDKNNGIEKQIQLVMKTFQNMGEPCKSLLDQFYYQKKSMKEIATYFNLDAASARNKKYRCMQKLRQLVEASEIK